MCDDNMYVCPADVPVCRLEVAQSFAGLSEQEKLYAHHFSMASWHGALIVLSQTSPESPAVFALLQKMFETPVEELREAARKAEVTDEQFNHALEYASNFYGNMGNYLSFGDTKFVPRLPKEAFRTLVGTCARASEAMPLFELCAERLYSLNEREKNLGLEEKGISAYYSPDITFEDVKLVQEFMDEYSMSPYNTRLFKTGEKEFELRVASALLSPAQTFEHKAVKISIVHGDHSPYLQRVVSHLEEARKFAANDTQRQMIAKYVDHFTCGSVDDHKDSQRHWIRDLGPAVETNIGFIESYRDPYGVRGEFEGFVSIVNKEMSEKFASLVRNAEAFLAMLPWPKDFEKDTFLKPDFTSLEVLCFASSGIPAGINIPNYDDIRQHEGFKNVSLGNVLSAHVPLDRVTFLSENDEKLFKDLQGKAFEVQVGLHELLGHGSGKLLSEDDQGILNFDRDTLTNPLKGGPITSWYKPGETWDSKFTTCASTIEECRAEAVGLYLSTCPEALKIFGYEGDMANDVMFVNWLIMCRGGLLALEFYTPSTRQWRQAHMQARYAILRTLLAAGDGVLKIEKLDGDLQISLDREKIRTSGCKAIRAFLVELMTYKATADLGAISWYTDLTSVSDEFMKMRAIVLEKKKPRKVFVQPHTLLKEGHVVLEEFEASNAGMIASFQRRFGADVAVVL